MAHASTPNGGLMHAKYGRPLTRQFSSSNGGNTEETQTTSNGNGYQPRFGKNRLSAKEQRARSRQKSGRGCWRW